MYAAASVVGDAALAKKAMGKLMTRSDWKLERDKDDKWICNLKGEIPQGLDMSGAAAAAFVSQVMAQDYLFRAETLLNSGKELQRAKAVSIVVSSHLTCKHHALANPGTRH